MINLKTSMTAIKKSARELGLMGTAARCLAEPLYRFREWRFDARFHVETAGIVATKDLDINESDRRHAERYQPVRLHAFAEIMGILDIRHEDFTFVDFGAGKGRVILLASRFPFQRIIGVEASPSLCRIAITNLQTYRNPLQKCRTIHVICANAATYCPPLESTVLYFFSPFGQSVMSTIVASLRQSLLDHPRRIFLILDNPVLDRLVSQAGIFKPYKLTWRYSIYESA